MQATTGRLAGFAVFVALAMACAGDQPVSPPTADHSTGGRASTMGGPITASSNGGVIHACVLPSGVIKVVPEGEACPEGQTALQWNTSGPPGLSGYQVIRVAINVAAGGFRREFVACPAGKVVLGGGAQVDAGATADFQTTLQESAPAAGALVPGGEILSGWLVAIRNNDGVSHTISIKATCASIA